MSSPSAGPRHQRLPETDGVSPFGPAVADAGLWKNVAARRMCVIGAASWAAALLFVGCQTLSPSLVPCPLPVSEQAARIRDIVPPGTPREEALAKLKKAGIEGTLGSANSIFYCDTWKQSDQERWHINVELLFDKDGKLYAYRPEPGNLASRDDAGTAKLTKPPKEVASAKQTGVVDPFAE